MLAIILRFLLFVVLTLHISSCVTTRSLPIETLQPARLDFEGARKNIAISSSPTLLSEATLLSDNTVSVPADSLIANILFSLQLFLKELPGYDDANLSTYTAISDEQAEYSNYDLLIQLDRLQISNAYYGQQYGFFEWEAYLYVHYAVNWSIRNASGSLIDNYSDRDDIIWRSGIHIGKSEAVDNLPSIKDACWDTGIAIAQRYADRIAPRWQTGARRIYMVNKFPDLSLLAYKAMQNDAYMRAFDIWESMLFSCRKRGQKKTKSQITYNMAVAYEFQNQLEQALYWAQRSANLNMKTRTANYIRLLKERQQYKEQLDKQLIDYSSR